MPNVGVVGALDVQSPNATGSGGGLVSTPGFWGWFFLGVAVLIIMGFHWPFLGQVRAPER